MHLKYLHDPKNAPKAAWIDAAANALGDFTVAPLLIGCRTLRGVKLTDRLVADYLDGGLTGTKTVIPQLVFREAWPGNRRGQIDELARRPGNVFLDVCTGISRDGNYCLQPGGRCSTKHLFGDEIAKIYAGGDRRVVAIYQDLNGTKVDFFIKQSVHILVSKCNAPGAVVHLLEWIKDKDSGRRRRGFAIVYLPGCTVTQDSLCASLQNLREFTIKNIS